MCDMERRIIVLDYDEKWKDAFIRIKERMDKVLADKVVSIEHVGSTSVIGLAAKPIIDIDIIIKDKSDLEEVTNRLNKIGYVYEGELGVIERYAFCYVGEEPLHCHNLYVCPETSEELKRHLIFRDYLRNHPEAVKYYGNVKKEGAKLYPNDIDKYIEYKSECVSSLYKESGLL